MHKQMYKLAGAAILGVLVCSTLVWLLLGIPSTGIDDAGIYLVYARNFLSGHGLVYNAGGWPAEGFASLLWLLVCSFVYIFSLAPEVPLLLINLLFGIVTVYICLKRCNQKPAFLILLCAAPAWFAWCQVALVETGLWCLLLTASILAVSERNIPRSAWLLPLLALTRPESILWGCWLLLMLLVGLGMDRGWRGGVRKGFRAVFAFGITCTALVLFRGLYFGSVLSAQGLRLNPAAGLLYFFGYLFSNPVVLLVMAVFGWVCIRELIRKRGLSPALMVCACLLPGLIIPLAAGDESFRAFRYYQPLWPLLCLVAAWALPLFYERLNRPVRLLAPVALILSGWIVFTASGSLQQEFNTARQSREHGTAMARMFEGDEPLPSIGTMTAGGCKYAYPGEVYNLKGLTKTGRSLIPSASRSGEIKTPFNRKVFYRWSPDIIVRVGSNATDMRIFSTLQTEPAFQQRYLKGELWYNDEILFGYFSREYLNGLKEGHYAFNMDLQYALSMENPLEPSDGEPEAAPPSELAAQIMNDLYLESRSL